MKDIRDHWGSTLECPVKNTQTLHILGIILLISMLPFFLYLMGRLFCVQQNKTLMRRKHYFTKYKFTLNSFKSILI
jgi:hypothetical protein